MPVTKILCLTLTQILQIIPRSSSPKGSMSAELLQDRNRKYSIGLGIMVLKTPENKKKVDPSDQKDLLSLRQTLLTRLHSLSGKEILDQILDQDNPRQLVQHLAYQDFLWLVKRTGEEDCLPLLELSSEDQWQYLLDLELWRKDRLNLEQSSRWLARLAQADSRRLVRWLFGEGEMFAYYHLFKSIQVEVKKEDDSVHDIQEGFFTVDGVFYVRVLGKEHRQTIENVLRTMAGEDLERYHAILLKLAGVIPAEVEEEMYRLRNVRLAEQGFLPFEEAIAIYAPLNAKALNRGDPAEKVDIFLDEETRAVVPISPLDHVEGPNLLTAVTSGISDNLFLDRIRLEFAGICNQILSADGILANELDVLVRACKKAAGYLNLALESLCGTDISLAEKIVRGNFLGSIFRVGFGLALELKWEAERWLKGSWFYNHGLDLTFWGDDRGEILSGIVKKSGLYTGLREGEAYKDFEMLSELNDCRELLHRLKLLDRVLAKLTVHYPLDKEILQEPQLTFYPLLFNIWARKKLKMAPCFSGVSLEEAKDFFCLLRAGDKNPPFRMPGFKEIFIADFMSFASALGEENKALLKNVLSTIWGEFSEEYERVSVDDLDVRFTRFIWMIPTSRTPAR